eukprot:CAMPEP_0119512528 /NCGR_PEP_ID=MMETSP1344-20130328/30879_1 /TAXON_ID=236787 /ORGANISM="Florenciella parvula, Strain CCMP2471" /LENGTH=53 /DNA_ID=CAMNT_0007549659 /DNA_START=6 /DNA_END=164 /DNA_ORIENTATION=-
MRPQTTSTKAEAMASFAGPVKMAEGKISPNTRTNTTDMITAHQVGTSSSRKMG